MPTDGYMFDEKSVRRIGSAVRASESDQPGTSQGMSPGVNRVQVHTFVRETPDTLDSVTADTFNGIFVSTDYDYDFASLTVTCEEPRKDIPANSPRWEINHASFIEGCVFHGDLFHAINIAGKWHAVGTAHTGISGTYDSTDGTLVVADCNRQKVPVQVAITGFSLTDGDTYFAEWVRSERVYVVTATGCEEA